MKSVFFLILAFCGSGIVLAQTELAPVADKVRAQPLPLPAETPLVVLNPADRDFPRQSYTVKRTFAADGTFTVNWKSARVESVQRFGPDGSLLSGRQVGLGGSVTTQADLARTTVRTIVTENGKTKTDKTSALGPGIALREELQHLVLQAWSYGVRDGLKLQSLSPDGGLVGDFQIIYRPVNDITKLSDKYAYPEEFKTALAGRPYIVADMSLQGIGAFFFPHHFYLIYVNTASGLQFAGYFGEDPKNPTFQYSPRSP